jgi:hypothetical protein
MTEWIIANGMEIIIALLLVLLILGIRAYSKEVNTTHEK